MSGYRRFIAYVYEYVKDHKGDNKGFIKVEARNGQCRMYFRLNGKRGRGSLPCKIYGFVREGTVCRTILLGTCDLDGELVEFRIETPENSLAGSSYRLEDLAGIVFWEESGIRYATQWDESPILMNAFVFTEMSEHAEESEEKIAEEEAEKVKEEEIEEVNEELEEVQEEWISENGEEEENKELEAEEEEEPEQQEQSPEPELKAEEISIAEERWDFQPFADGEIPFCKKIGLQDISMRNHFLIHGYENYHHLLVGKTQGGNQYILGIPGIYDPQERFMAGVFGFPNFKAARKEGEVLAAEENAGQDTFGYWYRLVDAADLNL